MKDEGIDDERDLPYDHFPVDYSNDLYHKTKAKAKWPTNKNQRLYQQMQNARRQQRVADLIKALEILGEPSWLDRLKKRIHEFLRR